MLLVEELAGDVPERYVMQPNDRPPVGAPVAQIPVINLGVLSQEHAAGGGEEAARLRSALESWGIFLVTGHGVEPSLMDAMWNASRVFFRQPVEEKKKYTDDLADGEHYEDYHQGYGTKQVQSQDETSLEWSDRLLLQVEPQDQRKLHLWPESLRDILHEYSMQLQHGMLNNTLLPAMERLLGLRDNYLVGHLRGRATTFARMNYYPPCSRPDLVFGIKSHSDATLVSVLMVDDNDVDGLQVLKDDMWYNVPASSHPHTLLIIVGDATEIISNGVFKSPVHRVVTNAKKERVSMVMFYGPDIETEIGPADELIDDKRPSRFKKVMAHEYLALQYEHLSRGTRALDTMRI
ncbi:unnamed protein product [Alopecurus aequalis]